MQRHAQPFCPRDSKLASLLSCTGLQRLLAAIRELQNIGIPGARRLPCQSRHSTPGLEARGNRALMASLRFTGERWEPWDEFLFSGLHGFRRIIGVYLPCYPTAPRSLILVILFYCYSFIVVDWFALLVSELLH